MAKCPSCGTRSDPTLIAACPDCGTALGSAAVDGGAGRRSSTGRRWGGFAGGVVGGVGARLAVVLALGGGWGIYDTIVSADRDDGGAIAGAGDVAADELVVGDCLDWPDPDVDVVDRVDGIPCDEPHDAEIYAITRLSAGPGEPYPGFDGLIDEAADACVEAFEGYVGIPYELDEFLYFDFFSPTEKGWAAGDREIVCMAYRIDDGKLTVSVRAEA